MSQKTVELLKVRNNICPQTFLQESQEMFVSLFGCVRKKGDANSNGPIKDARIEAAQNEFRASRRSSNKLAPNQSKKISKPERRKQWMNSAKAMVQKMQEGASMDQTIFGDHVPVVGLGRTRLQKKMLIKLKAHRKKNKKKDAEKEEAEHGLARSIKPFRGGKSKKNSRSNKILRLGQRQKARIKAAAASKRAGMKRQHADFSKAQQRGEKTYYDDAKVTAAPFMKRHKKDARVSSNSMTMIPQWDALGPTLTKKVLPSLARSSTTPPAPSPGPLK